MARLKYFAVISLKCLLALASVSYAAEGLRLWSSAAASKITRLPLLSMASDSEVLEKVDGAILAAVVLTAALFWAWTDLFGNLLMPSDVEEVGIGRRGHMIGALVIAVGLACLDGALFSFGVSESRWGESGMTWSTAAMAFGFEFLVAAVAYMSVVMKVRIENTGD